MTKEEALYTWLPIISMGIKNMPELEEAFDMAIKALEHEPQETVTEFADRCRECGAHYGRLLNQKWIPVSERLPEKFRYVNCTCHSLIDDREDWVIETVYVPQPSNSPYSDWGNIPMLNDKKCEVIAWVYREIPEPYKAEGSKE